MKPRSKSNVNKSLAHGHTESSSGTKVTVQGVIQSSEEKKVTNSTTVQPSRYTPSDTPYYVSFPKSAYVSTYSTPYSTSSAPSQKYHESDEEISEESEEDTCEECGYVFPSEKQKLNHLCKFYGYFKCSKCSYRWQSAHAWKGELLTYAVRYPD